MVYEEKCALQYAQASRGFSAGLCDLQRKFPLLGNQGLEEDKADWSLCPEWIWAVPVIYLQTSEMGSILK